MSGQTSPRRAVVYGTVLCSCLLVLLGAAPTAAVVPPDGNQSGAPDADGGWAPPVSIDQVGDWVGGLVGAGDGRSSGGTGSARDSGAGRDGADRARDETVGVAAAASGDTSDCGSGSARADVVADGTYTAVLDRIEDDLAVLEVSDDAGDTHELAVELAALPTEGRHPDAVFAVRVTDGELQDATYDEQRSESRAEAAQDRFDRLTSQRDGDED